MTSLSRIASKPKSAKPHRIRKGINPGVLFLFPAVVVVGIFIAYPFFDSVWLSFQSYVLLGAPPHFIGLQNYAQMIRSGALWASLKITGIFVLANTIVQVLGGFGFAFLLNTKGLWGQRPLRSILLIPHTLTGVVASVLWLQIFSAHFGIANYALSWFHVPAQDWMLDHPMFVVVVANAWVGLGFAYLLFDAALQGIPMELYDAAKVDGAGVWRQLQHVTLPG
ncbi:MAG: sugar ABC transporter permease [Firmicutes bacterium]|nr:sugar ABC transporter permease [Bacillota bacterium]